MIEIPKKVGNREKIPVNSFSNSSFPESFLALPSSFAQSIPFFCIKKTTASFPLVVNSATERKQRRVLRKIGGAMINNHRKKIIFIFIL